MTQFAGAGGMLCPVEIRTHREVPGHAGGSGSIGGLWARLFIAVSVGKKGRISRFRIGYFE